MLLRCALFFSFLQYPHTYRKSDGEGANIRLDTSAKTSNQCIPRTKACGKTLLLQSIPGVYVAVEFDDVELPTGTCAPKFRSRARLSTHERKFRMHRESHSEYPHGAPGGIHNLEGHCAPEYTEEEPEDFNRTGKRSFPR